VTENRNVGQEVQAEIIKTVRRGQEAVLKGQEAVVGTVKVWAGTVRSAAPSLPDLKLSELKLSDLKLSELKLPFAGRLPKPGELAGHAYDLAGKLLASQRKLTDNVRHAAAPLLPGKSGTAGSSDSGQDQADK
jgi:hypothetical protein